jgi:hypothetical protein
VPTGGVVLEEVIAFLIDELSVRPRRADWRTILTETQATGPATG